MGILHGTSSCILVRPKPVFKLSELKIDADKDWRGFGITSVKEVASGMAKGDIVFFNGAVLERLVPGTIGTMLTTHDFGNDPTWSL